MYFFLVAIVLICILVGWQYTKYSEMQAKVANIPGPPKWPIFGDLLMFVGISRAENLKLVESIVRKYPKITCFMFGHQPIIFLSHPNYTEKFLKSQEFIEKSHEYHYLLDWISTGLLTSTGNKWFARRKVITPAFHFKILDQFIEVFDKHGDTFIQKLKESNGESIDVFQLITLCALDNICETAMGIDIQAQNKSNSIYVRAVKDMTKLIFERIFKFYLRSDFIFNLTPYKKKHKEILKILHDFTDSVIVKRREELMKSQANSNNINDDQEESGEKKKMAFLDILLSSTIEGKPLSNLDIREEVDTFMFEGHDTTSSAIAFCLYNLAKNPEIQQKAYEEVTDILGKDSKTPVTTKILGDLHYLEMVIKETLRLYPSVPGFGRRINKDTKAGDYVIPKGCNVAFSIYCMGRDPTLWPDPLTFDPERFSPDKQMSSPFQYTPFSAGPRNCIGQKFAMYEIKSTISKVLRNFEISVTPGFEPIITSILILFPENGIWLKFKNRNVAA